MTYKLSDFKVGDKVEFVNHVGYPGYRGYAGSNSLKEYNSNPRFGPQPGQFGRVKSVGSEELLVMFDLTDSPNHGFYVKPQEGNVIPVKKSPQYTVKDFQVGDKVEFVNYEGYSYYCDVKPGDIGTVVESDSSCINSENELEIDWGEGHSLFARPARGNIIPASPEKVQIRALERRVERLETILDRLGVVFKESDGAYK